MSGTRPGIVAVVVTYESSAVLARCLDSLRDAAPRRGVDVRVVDNASTDGSPELATTRLGEDRVVRRRTNGGFAAGVNEVLARTEAEWLAVINPDLQVRPGALDELVDFLEAHPRVGLVGPRVDMPDGRREPTAGDFPTPARERAHAWMLDRILGLPGRRRRQPAGPERVDWTSGCAWVVRRAARAATGPLDEGYFMYFEDVDYCRRLADGGWEVWCCPKARALHERGTGSRASGVLPADGGRAALRYLAKFHPEVEPRALARTLREGWRLRAWVHRLLGALGRRSSALLALRYRAALRELAPYLRAANPVDDLDADKSRL